MTWIESFLGTVNQKCVNCGKLISKQPYDTIIEDGKAAKVCSEWCNQYYREKTGDD